MSAESAAAIRHGLELAHWSPVDLWRAALAVGGAFTADDVAQLATGERRSTVAEHDILAITLNDHFLGLGQDHLIPYWAQLHP